MRSHARQFRNRTLPRVEALEDRMVPATIGAFNSDTATWYLRTANSAGAPDAGQFAYGGAGWFPVSGDWDGNGSETIGAVNPTGAGGLVWYLKNSNTAGAPDITPFAYGGANWIPVVGDWTGDGKTTIGAVDPTTMTWYLKTSNGPGAPDIAPFRYGAPGWIPVVGDWNGDGKDTIGVVDPTTMTWYLKNSNSPGAPDITPFRYGAPGWVPGTGDWNGDGVTTIGVVDPSSETWYLRNSNSPGAPDITPFAYGAPGWQPLTGDWVSGNPGGAITPALTSSSAVEQYSDVSLNRADLTAGTTRASVVNGTPLTLNLNVVQVSGSTVTAVVGARVDVWQADALGVYSDESSAGTAGEAWLRGYQMTGAGGGVTFTSIYPGWYAGRAPHLNFRIRLFSATGAVTQDFTSELFFGPAVTQAVYATAPYNTHGSPDTTNATDSLYNTPLAGGTATGARLMLAVTKAASGTGYVASFNVYLQAG
jgi:protocatechuate 3,4-dioxygenase beta subunit